MRQIFPALAAACLVATQAHAQDIQSQYEAQLLQSYGQSQTYDSFEALIRMVFRRADVDGQPGLTQADRAVALDFRRAEARARYLGQKLVEDLNGDFTISADELQSLALREATQPLRANGIEIPPTPDQIRMLASGIVARKLAEDADGDGNISPEELRAAAEAAAESYVQRGAPPFPPIDIYDADNDARLTEEEFVARLRAAFQAADTDGDAHLANKEIEAVRRAALTNRARPPGDIVLPSGQPRKTQASPSTFAAARAACKMPPVPEGHQVMVVGGYEGAALTDLYLGEPDATVELVDLRIPAGGPPITLIAPFASHTILRLDDAGGRLREIVETNGHIGLLGAAAGVNFARTDEACHLKLYSDVAPDNPDPGAFYGARLGVNVARTIRGYALGTVDLASGTTVSDTLLEGAVTPPAAVTRTDAWAHFRRFNPGGLIPLDPEKVQTSVKVGKHPVWPQQAGIARLVADAALVPLPREDIKAVVLENDAGEIRIGDKVFRPGAGDDAIQMGGLIYTEERSKTWVGRRPLIYLVQKEVRLPHGLTGAHGLQLALPSGTPLPQNVGKGVKLHTVDGNSGLGGKP